MSRFLDRLERRVINGCESRTPYLTRYYLLRSRWLSVYLHQFHRSDEGTELHDHPWHFVAVILKGGYWEWLRTPSRHTPGLTFLEQHWRPPGSILIRPAATAHRVEVDSDRLPWSLVILGPIVRKWGFHTPSGWMHWKTHLRSLGCLDEETTSQ